MKGAVIGTAILLMATACSSGPEPAVSGQPTVVHGSGTGDGEGLPEGAAVPVFAGPFGGLLENAYRQSTSDLQRTILDDGQITELEIAALRDDVVRCLQDAGVESPSYQTDGSLSAHTPQGWADDDLHSVVGGCQEQSLGQVDIVYLAMQRDPGNLGEAARMVPCLQEAGLVEPSFSSEDYVREMASGSPAFDVSDPRFESCLAAPAPTDP